MTLRITIPGLPPREIRGNYHPRTRAMAEARRRQSDWWKATAGYAIIDARNRSGNASAWKNLSRIKVVVTYILENNRRIDTDNLEGQAMKPVWDAMVDVNLITDDRHQVIYERTYKAEIDPKRGPATIVEVSSGTNQ